MNSFWIQIVHVYFPVTIAVSAQLVFLMLPVNLRTWRRDALNAWTYSGIQTFVAGLLFVVVPRVFELFEISDVTTFVAIFLVFIASWWKVIRTIPLEATFTVTPEFEEQPVVNFDTFYTADRLRVLGELPADDASAVLRHKALREMLVRKRVDQNLGDLDDA